MPHYYVKFQRDPPSGAVAMKKKTRGGGMQHHLTPLPGGVILDGVIMQKLIKWSLVQ